MQQGGGFEQPPLSGAVFRAAFLLLLCACIALYGITFTFTFTHFIINPLNAELNTTCHLLALLGAHLILHVSRIRVNYSPFIQRCCLVTDIFTNINHIGSRKNTM
jgi:hypothetical protein